MKNIGGKTLQWETQTTDLLYETNIRIETSLHWKTTFPVVLNFDR